MTGLDYYYGPHQQSRSWNGAVFLCVCVCVCVCVNHLTYDLDFWYGSWPWPYLRWDCRSRLKVKVTRSKNVISMLLSEGNSHVKLLWLMMWHHGVKSWLHGMTMCHHMTWYHKILGRKDCGIYYTGGMWMLRCFHYFMQKHICTQPNSLTQPNFLNNQISALTSHILSWHSGPV